MTTNNLTASQLKSAAWRKSSYSGGSEGQCVEIADLAGTPFTGMRAVRDSKDPEGPALLVPAGSFASFITAVKAGEFDI